MSEQSGSPSGAAYERKIKILQQWWQDLNSAGGEWKDVPLEME
jgi:hypothetical protein